MRSKGRHRNLARLPEIAGAVVSYVYPRFAFRRPPELDGAARRYPVAVVGAGPIGLATLIDLKLHGIDAVLLDEDDTVSVGSRGLCYAKRTLEILDRLGVGDRVVGKGVTWNVGRTFLREQEVYRFELLPTPDHKRPGMVNLQQYYLEEYLVARADELGCDLRWRSRVTVVAPHDDRVTLTVATPEGEYTLEADWLVVADGAKSPIRRMLGLDIEGQVFQDRFLIADVVMQADFPAERWFWFDPPFHPGQSVLLHRQADSLWRIDFQLGWEANPEEEKKPERVIPRIRAMLGPERPFELAWTSVYTFQCRRMKDFRHGRVLFAGDAAHQVSPFGARGANSGIQDADNLAWKLARVVHGLSPDTLLDSYSTERIEAADENIMNSTRSTDFITPKGAVSRLFRDATLELAREHAFARALVNSGRLSLPTIYTASPLSTPDRDVWSGGVPPGAPAEDVPLDLDGGEIWLIDCLGGAFDLVLYAPEDAARATAERWAQAHDVRLTIIAAERRTDDPRTLVDVRGRFAERYAAAPGTTILFRPDQHVCARSRCWDEAWLTDSLARACGQCIGMATTSAASPKAVVTSSLGFRDPTIAHPRPFSAADAFYEALIDAHRGLDEAESHALNARLILILAHAIGDVGALRKALALARPPGPLSACKEAP